MSNRILFVDDDPNFLKGIERVLRKLRTEWTYYFAHSVDAALDQIGKVAFDAIVSDVSMPGKDGFELLSVLQSSPETKDIPVIMLTGNHEHSLKRKALENGASDLLNKPINREDLFARLHSVMRLKSYQDSLKQQKELLAQKVRERTCELEESRLDIILRLSKAAEYRDTETGNHILRVGCYCRILAEEIGMTPEFTEMIFLASPLHDIGKIGIPDNILLKQGKLTTAERQIMQQHCTIGANILSQKVKTLKLKQGKQDYKTSVEQISKSNPLLRMASAIALTHHEMWDGGGYPEGLAGLDIPQAARIVALADVYDALRSVRPYKLPYSHVETLVIMSEQKGKHFDPVVFTAFEKQADEFSAIHEQYMDNGYRKGVGEKTNVFEEKNIIC